MSSKYDRALSLIDSEDYDAAFSLLDGLNYKDSDNQTEKCYMGKYGEEKFNLIKDIKVGDTFKLGIYEQDNNDDNGKEEIEWIVLEKEDMSLLLISKYALDCQRYNEIGTHIAWEECSLREWLNERFLKEAFSEKERNMLRSGTSNDNKDKNCNTTDQVFLLSNEDAKIYFASNSARQCQGTVYCYAQGACKGSNGNCWWWLRSTDGRSNLAPYVSKKGVVLEETTGCSVHVEGNAI